MSKEDHNKSLNFPKVIDPTYKNGEAFSLRVYTPSQESPYLIFKNVPKLSLLDELKSHLEK